MGSPTHDAADTAADTSVHEEHGTDTEQASESPVEVNTQGGDAVVNTAPDGGGVDNNEAPAQEDTAASEDSSTSDSSDTASE